MTDVLLLMLPIFTMIAIGSLFVWRGWFPAEGLGRRNAPDRAGELGQPDGGGSARRCRRLDRDHAWVLQHRRR